MEISKQQIQQILKNKPIGTSDKAVLEGLIMRGYNLEGMDPMVTSAYRAERQTPQIVAGNQFEQKPKGFWAKARDFAANIIGGKKLAEGAGLALAAPKVQQTLAETQQSLYQTESDLIQRIKEKTAKGEDTTRLEAVLKLQREEIKRVEDAQKDFVDVLPTSKQVIGSAARLAGTAAGGAITGGAAKLTGVGQATSFGQGALRGAGAGALTGGIEGAIQGSGIAAEKDKSSEEIIASGALGAVSGSILGGSIGAVTGGIGGAIRGKAIRKENFAKSLVSPKETAKSRAEALRQGRLEDPGLFKKAEIKYSKQDERMANAIKDVVDPKATIGENIDAIRLKVSNTNSGVENYIKNNKVPFNTNQLKSKLLSQKSDLDLIFASDATAEKTYDAVVDAFMKNVSKKDTLGLFQSRQTFDQIPAIQKLLNTQSLGENTRKEIVLAVRDAANEYISSQLPKGNIFRSVLADESLMLRGLTNLAEKSQSIVGKNKLQLLTQEYPILKWIIGGFAAGAVGAAGVGVGSTIVGSTD